MVMEGYGRMSDEVIVRTIRDFRIAQRDGGTGYLLDRLAVPWSRDQLRDEARSATVVR